MKFTKRYQSVLLGSAAAFALTSQAAVSQEVIEANDAESTRRLNEITVTATRREAPIQDVPIAVTALNAVELERQNVLDLRSLDQLSASFNLNSSTTETNGTTLRIRGVGTTGNNIGLESAVGVFLDGVFLSRPGIALGDLVDLQQLEVLRGPQGTLFGRNTSAGALNIQTAKPNLSEVDGFANASYGNLDFVNVQGGFSLPLVEDQLGLRLSGAYRRRDGFVESTAGEGIDSNDRDRFLIRGQLYWEPTDNISIRLIGDYAESNEECCAAGLIQESNLFLPGLLPGGLSFANLAGLPNQAGAPASGFEAAQTDQLTNAEQFENPSDQWGISGQLDWDLGFANLTYIGAFRDFSAQSVTESDFVDLEVFSVGGSTATNPGFDDFPNFTDITNQTHELRLQGKAFNDRLDWLIGGFYSNEEIDSGGPLTLGADFQQATSVSIFPLIPPGSPLSALTNPANFFAQGVDAAGNFALNQFDQDSNSFSFFTHNTFAITDAFDFTVGLRYADENKDGSFEQLAATPPGESACFNTLTNPLLAPGAPSSGFAPLATTLACFPFSTSVEIAQLIPGAPTPQEFDDEFNDEELIWTLRGVYALSDDINVYGSFTHGFKAGGFNLDSSAAVFGADPTFESEEIDVFELGIKSTLFGGRVRANATVFHQEIDDFQVLEFTGTQFVTFNVPEALSTGAELEVTARIIDQLTLNTALTYTNARYPNDCAGDIAAANVTNLCGEDLTNAPDFVGIWGATWEDTFNAFGTDLAYFGNVNVRYETERRTSTQATFLTSDIPLPFAIQDENTKVNLRVGVGSPDGRWQIEGWAVNLTDEITRNVTFNVAFRGGTFLVPALGPGAVGRGAFTAEPRTYGVTLRTRF
ncbi:MAG: TonB-dependent receptor [Pseudomonadota bacterium]